MYTIWLKDLSEFKKIIMLGDREDDRLLAENLGAIFLDVRNKMPQTLRNIKCRILNEDLEPIETIEHSVITLLIQ